MGTQNRSVGQRGNYKVTPRSGFLISKLLPPSHYHPRESPVTLFHALLYWDAVHQQMQKSGVSCTQTAKKAPSTSTTAVSIHRLTRQSLKSTTWWVLLLIVLSPRPPRVGQICAESTRLIVLNPLHSLWPEQLLSLHCPYFSSCHSSFSFIQLHLSPH